MFSAVRKTHLNFKKSFTVLPALGDLKGCVDGRKAQNKQADESGKKIFQQVHFVWRRVLDSISPR